jgi:hypothetical protein
MKEYLMPFPPKFRGEINMTNDISHARQFLPAEADAVEQLCAMLNAGLQQGNRFEIDRRPSGILYVFRKL